MCHGDTPRGHLWRDGFQANKNGAKKTKNTGLQAEKANTMALIVTVKKKKGGKKKSNITL